MKTIVEKNRMIAEFMGIEEEQIENGEFVFAVEFQNPEKLNDVQVEFYYGSELRYHTSWDWLMPVVKKCRKRLFSPRNATEVYMLQHLEDAVLSFEIDEVFEEVVNVVEWYNENL